MNRSVKNGLLDALLFRPAFKKYKRPESFDHIESNMVDMLLIVFGFMIWFLIICIPIMIVDLAF